jgi:polyisoprenoid-binding protein YceI
MIDLRKFLIPAIVAAGLVAACAVQAPTPHETARQAPANLPDAYYRQAVAQGSPVFRVDSARSLVVFEVRRGGSYATFGHDHVVASHDVQGYIAPEPGRADLAIQLDRLVVDEPELRAEAKFDTQPSTDDIAGTRRNMLRAFEAEQYPFVLVEVAGVRAEGANARLAVTITLHGTKRTLEVPALIDAAADAYRVTGRLAVKQTDFGIKPLSILGGALQVQDEVIVRFSILSRRIFALD